VSVARGKLYSLNSLGMAFEGTHQEALITPHALRMASGKHLPSLQMPSFLRFFDILVYLSLSFSLSASIYNSGLSWANIAQLKG
jgi:hypothetical protein